MISLQKQSETMESTAQSRCLAPSVGCMSTHVPTTGHSDSLGPEPTTADAAGIGRLRGLALYTASLLGAGLLVMPSLAYDAAGPASLVAWTGLLLLSIPIAFTFANLGARRPDAGGVASFVLDAFGPRAGAVCGYWFILALPFGAPATAIVGGQYVAGALGVGRDGAFVAAMALLVAAISATLAGLRIAGSVQLILMGGLAAILVAAALGALPEADTERLTPFFTNGWTGVFAAAGVLFFSFAGWEAVAPLTQEFKRPARDVQIVTAWTLVLVSAIYLVLAVSAVLALGPAMAGSTVPVQQLLGVRWPSLAGPVTGALAAVLTYGAMTAYLTGASRMAAALARDGWLPRSLSAGAERGGTPRRTAALISAMSVIVLALIHHLDASLDDVMALASAMFIAVTLAGLLAGVRLAGSPRAKGLAGSAAIVMVPVLAGTGWAALYPIAVAAFLLTKRAPQSQAATR